VRGILVLLGLVSSAGWAGAETPTAVPTYGNDDLRRMAPLRHQTGVLSQPAIPPDGKGRRQAEDEETKARRAAERHWRREADRVRKRQERLRERIEDLRAKIEKRRRSRKIQAIGDPQIESWQRRIERLRQRLRDLEMGLEERARRAGALPGWLR
jgi:hypothetical protein